MGKSSLPKTCGEAKAAGLPFFYTGKPCKYGHLALRRTSDRKCVDCEPRRTAQQSARVRAQSEQDREAHRAVNRRWKDEHRPHISAYMREYSAANADRIAISKSVCYQARKEHYNALNRGRAVKERTATPAWLSDAQWTAMLTVYATAARLTRETGIPHEVDHIVPILGKNVCGLHVPWNLQVLTRTANRSKGNKHHE